MVLESIGMALFRSSNPLLAQLIFYICTGGVLSLLILEAVIEMKRAISALQQMGVDPSAWKAALAAVYSLFIGALSAGVVVTFYFLYVIPSLLTPSDFLRVAGVWLLVGASTAVVFYASMAASAVAFVRMLKVDVGPIVEKGMLAGMTLIIPGVGRKIFASGEEDFVDYVMTHEEAHARSRAVPLMHFLFLLSSMLIGSYLYIAAVGFLRRLDITPAVHPFFAFLIIGFLLLSLIFLRALEVHADFAVYSKHGASGGEQLLDALNKRLEGVPPVMRFLSRLTHTGRRDLALVRGDPLGAHGVWDFAVPSSFFTSALVYGFFVQAAKRAGVSLVDMGIGGDLILSAALFVGSLIVTFLLSLVLRPVVHRMARGFTDRGVSALSSLIASVYMASAGAALFLLPTLGLLSLFSVALGALLNYTLARHYLSLVRGGSALKLILASYAVLAAVSALLLAARGPLYGYLP